ncbi:MAG: ATP-dependent zinc metalloprotease FtsH [Patescibacteria group bacterium]|nr:MAG: ATP-dependent zinc metalloprotease FtsH [Patescibacteria group bacterium]
MKKNQPKIIKQINPKFEINIKNVFIFLFILFFLFSIFQGFSNYETSLSVNELPINELVDNIKEGKVDSVKVERNRVIAVNKDKTETITYKEEGQSFTELLKDYGVDPTTVKVEVKDTVTEEGIWVLISNLIPTLLIIGFFIFLFRQARGAQDSIFSFGQSRAKRFSKDMPKTTFKDVAGVDEAKQELEEVVDFLKNPEKYKKLGARTPKGIILIGPPGCGKTLLARAIAGEANVPFFSIAGSEFMEMLVGVGAARVRDLFATAKKNAPAIIFIDEIDAIGRARSFGPMPAHDEREQTLNQILVEMDGFAPYEQIIVIAATNRGDLLDPALLRPGRFDRRITLDYPDYEGRKAILQIHSQGKPFDDSVNWEKVARRTIGFSGADLENMLNEAAIKAARDNRDKITADDIEEAAMKVKLGPEKKRLQSEYDKKLTAYHESGHAIAAHFLPNTDPVHRISIVSRGMALGYTLLPPSKDKVHETKSSLLERIIVTLGGRAAEEIVFGEVTTGAANDFDQATKIARMMVTEYGMSKLGPINYGSSIDIALGGYTQNEFISQATLSDIDKEVAAIINNCYKKAKKIITEHRDALDKVSTALLKNESLDEEEFEKLVGKKVQKKDE